VDDLIRNHFDLKDLLSVSHFSKILEHKIL
jgi:hypothetical protein